MFSMQRAPIQKEKEMTKEIIEEELKGWRM